MSTIVFFFDFCPLQYSPCKEKHPYRYGHCTLLAAVTFNSPGHPARPALQHFPGTIRVWEFHLNGNKLSRFLSVVYTEMNGPVLWRVFKKNYQKITVFLYQLIEIGRGEGELRWMYLFMCNSGDRGVLRAQRV
jgi:hypothetical protein